MHKDIEKNQPETSAAFALATLLLNILILVILCGSIWMLHVLAEESSSLNLLLRDYTIYR